VSEFLSGVQHFLSGAGQHFAELWTQWRGLPLAQQVAWALVVALLLLPLAWIMLTLRLVLPMVRRSLRQHSFSTSITVLAVALASGLTMSVFSIAEQCKAAFAGGPVGFDAVLGARGSPLQLVLNTVFHLETSPGNIPWSLYQQVRERREVELAIPYAVGDNYRGFRIVGTTEELFTRFEYAPGRRYRVRAPGKPVFAPDAREAIVGSYVARQTGLRVGAHFHPVHSLHDLPEEEHEDEYLVVGVLEPTNTPADRVIWIPIEGFFRMEGHAHHGAGVEYIPHPHEDIPDEHKELSAVMLKFRGESAALRLEQEINKLGRTATLAWPIGHVMADLFNKLGWVNRVLELVAYLVVIVAAGTILASIYNTINERRREIAILRSLGARRSTVFSAVVLEAATIGAVGSLLGFAVYAAILAVATIIVREQTGVVLDWLTFHGALWQTPLAMTALGALAGIIPAAKAYGTDVATNLTPMS
jgi:putative ABC transport system permease protein